MRARFFIIMILFSCNLFAQHCPWDGSTLIAVKLMNKKGQPLNLTKDTVYLIEIENADAAKCSYADELLKKPLFNTTEFFEEGLIKYGANYGAVLKKRLESMGVVSKSNLFVSLNQAEKDCMIKKDNDFSYKRRKFVIVYDNGKTKVRVDVPPDALRSLCTSSKDFVNFSPIEIKVD